MGWRSVCVASFSVLFIGLAVAASTALSGSFEATLAIDPSALGLGDALLPDTLSTLTLQARLDSLSVSGLATFDPDGLDYLSIGAAGAFGGLSGNSSLTFYPLGDTRTKTKTVTEPAHCYDWGLEYFVSQLIVEDVNATSSWYVRVSADGMIWTTVTGVFGSTAHTSGSVPVNFLIRYVEVRASTGILQASPSSPEKLTISYSNQLWRTSFTLPYGGFTLFGTLAVPAAGSGYVSMAGSYQDASGFSLTAFVKLGLRRPALQLSFEQAVLSASFSIGQIEGVSARIVIDDSGLDVVSLMVEEVSSGLSWLAFSGELTLTVLTEELDVEPELTLDGGTCLTLYGKVLTGTRSTGITGISLYGIGAGYDWNGLEFSSLSYLDDVHSIAVLGSQSCWEALTFSVSKASCCGGAIDFKCTIGFSKSSVSLFGWAETDIVLTVGLSATTSLAVSVAVEIAGFTYLAVTFSHAW